VGGWKFHAFLISSLDAGES